VRVRIGMGWPFHAIARNASKATAALNLRKERKSGRCMRSAG
jgi:hypothetical protein